MMMSSARREMWTMRSEQTKRYSATKSRSATDCEARRGQRYSESGKGGKRRLTCIEFPETLPILSSERRSSRSTEKGFPARAPEPRGRVETRL